MSSPGEPQRCWPSVTALCATTWRDEHTKQCFSWIKTTILSSVFLYLLAMTEVSSRLSSVPHYQHENMIPLFILFCPVYHFMLQELAGFNPHWQTASSSLAPSPIFIPSVKISNHFLGCCKNTEQDQDKNCSQEYIVRSNLLTDTLSLTMTFWHALLN